MCLSPRGVSQSVSAVRSGTDRNFYGLPTLILSSRFLRKNARRRFLKDKSIFLTLLRGGEMYMLFLSEGILSMPQFPQTEMDARPVSCQTKPSRPPPTGECCGYLEFIGGKDGTCFLRGARPTGAQCSHGSQRACFLGRIILHSNLFPLEYCQRYFLLAKTLCPSPHMKAACDCFLRAGQSTSVFVLPKTLCTHFSERRRPQLCFFRE